LNCGLPRLEANLDPGDVDYRAVLTHLDSRRGSSGRHNDLHRDRWARRRLVELAGHLALQFDVLVKLVQQPGRWHKVNAYNDILAGLRVANGLHRLLSAADEGQRRAVRGLESFPERARSNDRFRRKPNLKSMIRGIGGKSSRVGVIRGLTERWQKMKTFVFRYSVTGTVKSIGYRLDGFATKQRINYFLSFDFWKLVDERDRAGHVSIVARDGLSDGDYGIPMTSQQCNLEAAALPSRKSSASMARSK
jgi:hypothetical protein